MPSATTKVHQGGAQAGRDIVGRDKTEHHVHLAPRGPGVVEELLKKLQKEVETNAEVRHTIEALAHFQTRQSSDGIDGLEAKLEAAGRIDEQRTALEKKEMFVKLLEQWSLYASAQEIFAHLLAKAEFEFTYFIQPQLNELTRVQINEMIGHRVVEPTVETCGSSIFAINHGTAMGMVYWLAEQCFIRWHQ